MPHQVHCCHAVVLVLLMRTSLLCYITLAGAFFHVSYSFLRAVTETSSLCKMALLHLFFYGATSIEAGCRRKVCQFCPCVNFVSDLPACLLSCC